MELITKEVYVTTFFTYIFVILREFHSRSYPYNVEVIA
jgi:hypothetical protein